MNTQDTETRRNILKAAETEFLERGFKSASLRNIVKSAGVTTGAFYGYFPTKEALFSSLVEDCANAVMNKFLESQEEFEQLPTDIKPENMGKGSGIYLKWLLSYIYDNYASFKLLICSADGTKYADFVHQMVEIEVEQTLKFIDVLNSNSSKEIRIDRQLCHIISSGMFSAVFEILVHDMPKPQTEEYIERLCDFQTAGWARIMGL